MKILKSVLFTISFCMGSLLVLAQTNPKPFVIPSLQKWEGATGHFALNSKGKIRYKKSEKSVQKLSSILLNDFKEIGINGMKAASGKAQKGDIVLQLLPQYDNSLKDEGYNFNIADVITISANTYRGLFWGTRTLLQLLEQSPEGKIVKGKATDFPKYEVRGFMLDDGRKYFTMEFLKRYVKLLAYYKISDFQIHLNDNGFHKYFNNNWDSTYSGFRLESSTYPNLATKGEFYTKKEFRDFQLMALDYGVTIIPEIDVPAHSLAFSHAIPEIKSKKYGDDHLDINNPKTYEVVENVFKEYLSGPNPVFVGKEVHIGTDEYDKTEAESFRKFTDHFIKYVQSFGKDVRAWGALTHAQGKTPVKVDGVTLNMWYNGYADPEAMKKLGYKMISTPDDFLYIVPAAGYYYDYLNLPYLYKSWSPVNIGKYKMDDKNPLLRGGMFAVWNDIVGNGITAMDVHDRVFPALQVLSEKMWSSVTDTLDYKGFENNAKKIGEGPGLNMSGQISKQQTEKLFLDVTSKSFSNANHQNTKVLVFKNIKVDADKNLDFSQMNSQINTPIEHLGFNYDVQFDIYPVAQKGKIVLFKDSVWNTSVQLNDKVQFVYYRDNFVDSFNAKIIFNQWSTIQFKGDKKAVSLFINLQWAQTLKGYK
ncbi:MAG: beta-N-acetylhexosaminidase, partial [Chitinophagaceae bacterium]